MIRYRLTILLAVFVSTNVLGQTSDLSQFFLILPKAHPALAGVDDFFQINMSYSQPLNNVTSTSGSYALSMFKALGNNDALGGVQRGSRVSNPKLIQQYGRLPSIRRRHGVGFLAENTQLGPQEELDIRAYYSYHIPISKRTSLSLGTSAGIYQNQVDFSSFQVRNPSDDIFYQNLIQSEGNQIHALLDLGVSIYSQKFYLSISGRSLIDEALGGNEFLSNFSREQSINGLIGYKIRLSSNIRLHMNGAIEYSELYNEDYFGAIRVLIHEIIYLGGAYDHDSKWSVLAGFNVSKKMYLSYAYDRHTDFLNEFSDGSHHLTLSLALSNFYFNQPYAW
ncbi:MAG: PorP/SprF family type IX secretion system membrane protein [Bacteroidota bacterium]